MQHFSIVVLWAARAQSNSNKNLQNLSFPSIQTYSDSLAWKCKMVPWKTTFLYEQVFFHIHVSESECISSGDSVEIVARFIPSLQSFQTHGSLEPA